MTNTTHTLRLIDEYLTQGGYTPGIDDITLNHEAHLVAAAPDLLAALENLMDGACEALSFLDRETVRHLKPLIDSAETAVLKAKGN